MKNFICILLALVLLIPTITVIGAETAEMEKILLSVKERIPETETFENFDSRINTYSGKTTYSFEWYSDRDTEYSSLSLSVTDTGIITRYSYYSSENEKEFVPSLNRISSDEALKKAEEAGKKLNPSIADELRYEKLSQVENIFDDRFRFRIVRYVNNLPVAENTGSITVDLSGDTILNYNMSYTENIEFPDPSKIITENSAKDFYKKNAGLELRYQTLYKDRSKTVYPIYVPSEEYNTYIDALTGELITVTPPEIAENSKDMALGSNTANGALREEAALSPEEKKELENIEGLLSEKELTDIITKNEFIAPDKGLTKNSYYIYKDFYDKDKYYAVLEFSSKEKYANASYTFNAANGELISYRGYEEIPSDAKNKKVETQFLDSAIKSLAGNKFSEYRKENETEYSQSYTRYVNEIPTDDTMTISINRYTGKISSYYITYSETDFPDISNVLSPDDAADSMFEQIKYTPYYKLSGDSAVCVYVMDAPISVRINPINGKLMNYDNTDYTKDMPLSYKDTEGHWAKDIIEKLASFGIGFEGENFLPDAPVTKEEYITLLVSSFMNNQPIILKDAYDNTREISQALRSKIADKDEDLSEELTREKAAVYMIRVMEIEKYASLSDIYIKPFKDVSEYAGYIAILSGLNIVKGDSYGNFNPKSILTRAQAMSIIYNALTK